MTNQSLIYETIVPVSQERHAEWHVQSGTDYAFACSMNSVPLMAAEFPIAASEYAIIFGCSQEGEIVPAILLGMHQKNFYLSDTGEWKADYIPAFLRRYPFVLATNEDDNSLTLCIDEKFEGCNQEGFGQKLFESSGEPTQYLQAIFEFSQKFQMHFQLTQNFCKKLKELNLLEFMKVSLASPSGEQLALNGFMAVNREKLKALSSDQLAELTASNELELIFLHLQSLRNFSKIGALLSEAALETTMPE